MGYYCGIDLACKETVISIIDGRRQVVSEVTAKTTEAGMKKAFKGYRGLECIVEASPMAEWLSRQVEKLGHRVVIVCPRKAKAALGNRGKKTDRRDARSLAELCRSGWYEAVHRKSAEARELRSYMTARKQIVENSTAIGASIRGILRAHGVTFGGGTDEVTFSSKVREAMKELPLLAQQGIKELLKAFELLHEQGRMMYRELQKQAKKDVVIQRLTTIPGVGAATATAFVATIDDPTRFPSAEKVASYLGLTPSVYQSGETEYRGRITKSGDKLLRWLLVEAAHVLLNRSDTPCDLKRWGLDLQEKKGTGKARVAVARRLCGIMWKMWKDETTFYPEAIAA
jgi:transposase